MVVVVVVVVVDGVLDGVLATILRRRITDQRSKIQASSNGGRRDFGAAFLEVLLLDTSLAIAIGTAILDRMIVVVGGVVRGIMVRPALNLLRPVLAVVARLDTKVPGLDLPGGDRELNGLRWPAGLGSYKFIAAFPTDVKA